jgi:hypothetical protein
MTDDPREQWDRDIEFSEEDEPAPSWRTELRDPEEEVEWVIRDLRQPKPDVPARKR